MDLIQAKTLVKKSVIKLVGESKAREHSHKINSSGIFKEEFGLPLSPRIIEKLVLLFCRRATGVQTWRRQDWRRWSWRLPRLRVPRRIRTWQARGYRIICSRHFCFS